MFDREAFRAEIEAQLKGVPRDKCVAFALRSALRVLPLLAVKNKKNQEAFWFWKAKDRERHLLAVLRAYNFSLEYALTKKHAASGAAIAIDVYVAADAAYTVYAYAAADAAAAAYAADAAAAAHAAHAAAYAYDASAIILHSIRQDLLKSKSGEEIMHQALWVKVPDQWQELYIDFKEDALRLNAGFDVWLDWYEDRLQGKAIDVDLLKKWNAIPKEIQGQGAAKVNAYLKESSQTTHPLNRVRAIFIGYGEAGKTSLIRALHGEEIKAKEPMTPGIEIRDWSVPDSEIHAHFWDFGGQVVFHSTHKFFLRSSCVYIIVINARADKDEDSEQAEYWLDHVKTFGGSAPVLLVSNKTDEAIVHLQMQDLKQKYPNIKGFHAISCTHAKTTHRSQFETFKNALTHELKATVQQGQIMFTPAQSKVLDELRQNSLEDAFLSADAFQKICDKHGVSDEGELNRDWLVDIFDKLGVMLHFDELKTFHNAYMLNPRWLTHGVYTLMNAKQARLDNPKIVDILKNAKVQDEYKHLLNYPPDKCQFISQAMQSFKLCYPLSDGSLLIPSLLGKELSNDSYELKQAETLRFEFAFNGFLPRNLIGEFMVSRYKEIKDDLQSQRGAVFKSRNLKAEALVEADYHRRLIIMRVFGRDSKEYLAILYDAMLLIFGDLNLDYREWVNLPQSACLDQEMIRPDSKVEKAPYQQLLAYGKKNQATYIAESGLSYDLVKALGGIISSEKLKDLGITIHMINQNTIVTNSIVYGSIVAAEKIQDSFNNLTSSKADPAVRILLDQLLSEINALNAKLPKDQAQLIEKMASRADGLVSESKNETPDREWYEVSLKGLLEAANALGSIADPVLDIAKKLSSLLLAS